MSSSYPLDGPSSSYLSHTLIRSLPPPLSSFLLLHHSIPLLYSPLYLLPSHPPYIVVYCNFKLDWTVLNFFMLFLFSPRSFNIIRHTLFIVYRVIFKGNTGYCIAHGGGKRCTFPGCVRGARDKYFCAGHGGGKVSLFLCLCVYCYAVMLVVIPTY